MADVRRRLAVAELLLRKRSGGRQIALLQQAREILDEAWNAIDQPRIEVSLARRADDLEAAILKRNRDDYLAQAAAVVVYAVRSLESSDERWSQYVWDVTDELLEDINQRAASIVTLSAVKQAVFQVELTELREWAQTQDILVLVRALRPTVPASVRRIARAAAKVDPNVKVPAETVALADARTRALAQVGVATFAKALESLAGALPAGEADARWRPAADRILAAVAAGSRLSAPDERLLSAGFETIAPGVV